MQGMLEREGLPPALTREKQPASWLPSVGGRRAFVGNQGFCPHRLSPCFRSFSPKWPLADPTHHGQGQGPLMSHTRPASLEDSRCFSEGQEEAHKVTQTPGVGTPCTLVLHRRGRAAPWASGFLYTVPSDNGDCRRVVTRFNWSHGLCGHGSGGLRLEPVSPGAGAPGSGALGGAGCAGRLWLLTWPPSEIAFVNVTCK